ncbi:MAG: hypothetical protein IJS29_10080 [Selenomonadaceae bacterium]|nr:hypothetical protein [Selenomonadaceae bacterium]
MLIFSVVLALIIGYFFRKVLIDSMSNVKIAQEAQEYLARDTVNITTSIDTYLYTNISVMPKSNHDDDSNQNDDDDADDDSSDNSSDSDSGGSDD